MSYKDKEWLRRKYQNHTQEEIADMCGVARTTILRWMKRHSIETRDGWQQADGEYKDSEWLREKYVGEQRSIADLADECGVAKSTIRHWLKKFNIPIRGKSEAGKIRAREHPHTTEAGAKALSRNRSIHPNIFTHKGKGYEVIQCGVDKKQIHHHRLLSTLLVDDLSELDGKHVHHKDEIPWLNYLDGLEVVTPKEHKQRHA